MNDQKMILFGAGDIGEKTAELIGKEKIAFFLDNDLAKRGKTIQGIPVFAVSDVEKELQRYFIVITVSVRFQKQIMEQLDSKGISNYITVNDFHAETIRQKMTQRPDYLGIYRKAINWILANSIQDKGIICHSCKRLPYPEVTGYYIPTLLQWGYRDLAIIYAKWLCEIQKEDGAWYDTDNKAPYIFDSAQVLKGLLAIRELLPEADEHIRRGCNWILSKMSPDGRLITPATDAWGEKRTCSEIIHIYCISPLIQAGEVFQCEEYKIKAKKILNYYKEHYYDDIINFTLLSHFHAYVIEAMIDLGEVDIAVKAMNNMAGYQKENGAVPGYADADWVCSTGLFQLAMIWFRLGDIKHGQAAFEYACKLQNDTGGWYGSYLSQNSRDEVNDYFPSEEISWAVKFFLDALYYKNLAEFENLAESFCEDIGKGDGRYQIVQEIVAGAGTNIDICDVGCGKGRYLKNLIEQYPDNNYFSVDISQNVLRNVSEQVMEKKQGALTNIPYSDETFDVVYTCEALEHAIDIGSAIKELVRVTKPGGKIVVIDKNIEKLGSILIEEWEQWFDADKLAEMMSDNGVRVEVKRSIHYENEQIEGLFLAWIGTKDRK